MQTRSIRITGGCAAVLILAGSYACTSAPPPRTSEQTAAAKALAERSWTKEFQVQSILIAGEVSIEGPPGLIDHVAFKQFPDQQYSAKTTAEGFLQEARASEDAANPIWIQLDNLAINATRGVRVLERLSAGPVRIHARGEVLWKNLDTGQEQRVESLELVGLPAQ